MVICLERDADLHIAQLMSLPLLLQSLASVKSRLVLPFWYRCTRVVPDKGPLNRCVCVIYGQRTDYGSCWLLDAGSADLQCDRSGRCRCKPGVTGDKCDQCQPNFFNFGPEGCRYEHSVLACGRFARVLCTA